MQQHENLIPLSGSYLPAQQNYMFQNDFFKDNMGNDLAPAECITVWGKHSFSNPSRQHHEQKNRPNVLQWLPAQKQKKTEKLPSFLGKQHAIKNSH
ncbi:hypothetical protein [Desulfoplanes formicivorans]|uniref:hypothetical protein n=1 Tax=Desulfoplanes formicivorans TaxID=1592317 RepID=UPI00114D38E0|nr:hypothetical protein [Desulfoplanes formicivorans]